MNSTGYVIAAYGTFVALMSAYVGILIPRTRRRRRELAVLEAGAEQSER
jgi:hypothetical protein